MKNHDTDITDISDQFLNYTNEHRFLDQHIISKSDIKSISKNVIQIQTKRTIHYYLSPVGSKVKILSSHLDPKSRENDNLAIYCYIFSYLSPTCILLAGDDLSNKVKNLDSSELNFSIIRRPSRNEKYRLIIDKLRNNQDILVRGNQIKLSSNKSIDDYLNNISGNNFDETKKYEIKESKIIDKFIIALLFTDEIASKINIRWRYECLLELNERYYLLDYVSDPTVVKLCRLLTKINYNNITCRYLHLKHNSSNYRRYNQFIKKFRKENNMEEI